MDGNDLLKLFSRTGKVIHPTLISGHLSDLLI
jgi:hypothetical protein